MSAWGAGRGLQVMVSNQGLQPQTQQGLVPALSPTQSASSGGGGGLSMAPGLSSPLSFLPLPLSPPLLTGQF